MVPILCFLNERSKIKRNSNFWISVGVTFIYRFQILLPYQQR